MSDELALREGDLPAIADDNLVAMAERAEKRISAVNKIKTMALKVTNSHDWIDQQGKPYLQVSGAEKIARLFGISWTIDEPVLEHGEEGHFTYTYKGTFSLGGASIEAIGTRSSKDGFFKRYEYVKDSEGKSTKTELPASEIDKTDVKKGAYTNCIGNGITRLLGIRNLSYEELAAAGIKVEAKVSYQQTTKEESGEAKDNRAEIRRMILEMSGGKDADAKAMLQEITSFIPKGKTEKDRVKGKGSVADLSEAAVNVTYGKVKTKYEEWLKTKGSKEQGQEDELSPEDVFINCEAGIPLCETIEDVASVLAYAEKHGITGEKLADLRRQCDKKKVEIREAKK